MTDLRVLKDLRVWNYSVTLDLGSKVVVIFDKQKDIKNYIQDDYEVVQLKEKWKALKDYFIMKFNHAPEE